MSTLLDDLLSPNADVAPIEDIGERFDGLCCRKISLRQFSLMRVLYRRLDEEGYVDYDGQIVALAFVLGACDSNGTPLFESAVLEPKFGEPDPERRMEPYVADVEKATRIDMSVLLEFHRQFEAWNGVGSDEGVSTEEIAEAEGNSVGTLGSDRSSDSPATSAAQSKS